MNKTDFLVIGAGVVGLAVAAKLTEAFPGKSVVVLERHAKFGQETSSRNSEVIHGGIYYPPGSLKAQLCVSGNRLLYDFCRKREVPHERSGKLIVANSSEEAATLESLLIRGRENGVEGLEMLDGEGVSRLEPHINAVAALFSPSTGIVDTHRLMERLAWLAGSGGAVCAYRHEAVGIARGLGDRGLLARCLEQQARIVQADRRPPILFDLAGNLHALRDEAGARDAMRRGREGGRGKLAWVVEAARCHPGCAMLSAGAADEAVRAEEWVVADEMLGLSIACTAGNERIKLLRNRSAIRRGRLGDKEGAARDLLEVRASGALPTPELEELVDLLEQGGDRAAAAGVALELAEAAGWEAGRVTRAARLFEDAGDPQRARDLWRRAVASNADPGSVVALLRLLDPERDGEEIDRLMALVRGKEDLLDIPDHLTVLEVGVDLDLARGQDLEAVEGLSAMMDLDPGRRDPWQRIVHILERRGEWEALVRRMDERLTYAVAADDIARTAMAMGRILEEKLGDEDGAVAAFERVIAVLPGHTGANVALAGIAYRRRRWDLMERYLVALDGAEWNADVELWRARAAENFGRNEEALDRYRRMISRIGPTTQAVEGIARLAEGPQFDDEIIHLGNRLLEEVGPDNIKSHIHRRVGLAHKRRGDLDEARRELELADRISGGDTDTLELLEQLYGESDRHQDQAETLCRLAYSVEGGQRVAYLVRAAKLYVERLYEVTRAYHWLQRAADVAPDDPDVLLGLADCAWILDEKVVVARSLERFRLVAPGVSLGASRTYHLAAALVHTREWSAADVIEVLEQVLDRLGSEERADAEELLLELRRSLPGRAR